MQNSLIETIKRGNFIIELHHDSDCQIDQAIGDAPIVMVTSARYSWHEWNTDKRVYVPSQEIVKALDSADLDDLCNACGHEAETLPGGRVSIEFSHEDRKRFYKSAANAYAGILKYEDLAEIEVRQFQTNGRETVYAISNKSALRAWSGNPECNLESFADEIQAYLNGECYGYVIKHASGDEINEIGESVWGFVGDSSYVISEADSWIASHRAYVAKQKRAKLKILIRNHVPLHLRAAMLAEIS